MAQFYIWDYNQQLSRLVFPNLRMRPKQPKGLQNLTAKFCHRQAASSCLFLAIHALPKKPSGECRSPPCGSYFRLSWYRLMCNLRDPRVLPHSDKNNSSDPIPFNLKFPIKQNLRLSGQLLCRLDPVNGKKQL